MSTATSRLWPAFAVLLWAGCTEIDEADPDARSPQPDVMADGSDATDGASDAGAEPDQPATGGLTGRAVDAMGTGLGGLVVLCCSTSLCVTGETDEEGQYLLLDLEDPGPRKMKLIDTDHDRMPVLFWQELVMDDVRPLSRDVVVPMANGELVAWPTEVGGAVTLSEGLITLTAEPESLRYPIGTAFEGIRVVQVPHDQLPPYDVEPWREAAGGTLAFFFDPAHVEATAPAHLRVAAGAGATPNMIYDLWSLAPDTATLYQAGTASADADGTLQSDEGAQLLDLTTILLIPRE